MLSIGEFSKATSLTIKTLRYYHELSLLPPAEIDELTGYRYYSKQSFERVHIINTLKDMGFTLNEVKSIISQCKNEKELKSFIEKKLSEIDEKVKQLVSHKKRLNHFKELMALEKLQHTEIKEIEVKPFLAAGIKMHGRYEEISQGFYTMMKHLGGIIRGKPFCLHYEIEYKEENANFMPCFEIKKLITIAGIECFSTKAGKAISLVHRGPYNTLGKAYFKLFEYIQEKKYSITIPTMERYISYLGTLLTIIGKPL